MKNDNVEKMWYEVFIGKSYLKNIIFCKIFIYVSILIQYRF